MGIYVKDGTRLTLDSFELSWILNQESLENVKKFISDASKGKLKRKLIVNLRPCFVGEKRAFFHRWIDKEKLLLKINEQLNYTAMQYIHNRFIEDNIAPDFCDVTIHKITLGLVEYEDGTVAEVEPTSIRFDVECEKEV